MWQDLRFGWRILCSAPGFAIVAALTLALGIGANTAVFSIVNGVLLRPLPYEDPGRLVAIWEKNEKEKGPSKLFDSYRDFEQWSAQAHSFERVAAATWAAAGRVLTGRGPAKTVLTIPVSASFFSTLGVTAALGRTFTPDDEKHGCAVVLSDGFWRGTLRASDNAIGGTLTLSRQDCTVLGVMPRGFAFYPAQTKLWILMGPDFRPNRENVPTGIFARLKRGVSREQAQAEVAALHRALHHADNPERGFTPVVYDLQEEFTWLASRGLRTTLWALIGAVGFVLLIACLNVANLLLGRSVLRERELAVRAALGSGPGRLVRQLFIESLLLSALGSVLGVAFAFGAVQYFRHANPVELPVGADVSIHLPVLAFTALLAVATTFAFGLLPAWRASRVDVNQVLKASGRGMVTGPRRSLAWLLVMAEVALSVMLLTGGGLLMRSVLRMESAPLGFNPQHLIAVRTGLPEDRYPGAPRLLQFFDRARQTAGALPGVRGVAVSADRKTYNQTLEIQGAPSTEAYNVDEQAAGSEFFQVLGVPLLRGRIFDARDSRESEYVAIVNQALAREYFRGTDPIGRRVRIGAPRKSGPWLTIVGVVGNVKHTAVYKEMSLVESPELFRPLTQEPPRSVAIHVRMEGDQAAIGAEIQRRIAALDPELAIEIEPAAFEISKALAYPRFRALVFGAFAICALLLAAIGLHGVLGQAVARRAPEFGLRMALGARRSDIFRLVARQGGLPILAGAAAGILGSLALGRLLGSLLYGVRPTDPSTLASGVLLLLASGAAAITLPALRAAKADPMAALRDE